jgi:hypothetical protein
MERESKTAVTALLAGIAVAITSCTTMIRPVQCQGEPHQCNEVHDARFCEYEATESDGRDCDELGLAATSRFCVVSAHKCVLETSYQVSGRRCKVTQVEMLRASGECTPGLPTFMAP